MSDFSGKPSLSSHKAWFVRDPLRLKREKSVLAASYPALSWSLDDKNGMAVVSGQLLVCDGAGVPRPITVRIDIPPTYPHGVPIAYALNGRFPMDPDGHVLEGGQLCMWLHELQPLDFIYRDVLTTYVDHVVLFLHRALIYEQTGRWPGPAWAHGYNAYVDYLVEALGSVQNVEIFRLTLLSETVRKRNEPCICGSGKKYKACHQRAVDGIKHRLSPTRLQRVFSHVDRMNHIEERMQHDRTIPR